MLLVSNNLGQRQVLPSAVLPIHYNLVLTPDIPRAQYEGQVDINLVFREITDKIVLNSNELDIYNASLRINNNEFIYFSSKNVTYDTKLFRATLFLPKNITSSTKGGLSMNFRGKLNNEMNGFYRSSFKDESGNENYLATTKFEPTDARKAFPCWDEPAYKATFNVTLRVPKKLAALSNMNVIEEKELGESLKQVKYATTPKMSNYLLAFIVGDLDFIEGFTANNVKCRVYAPRGLAKQGEFALDVAVKSLDLFDDLFKIPYPLPKMDLVAIPDFQSGAMENWGLVTYRMTQLLLDESGSTKTKQAIANTVAHELAHQWFGNLVTMEWWNDLWLNEGFATWVANYAINKFYPEWDQWTAFSASRLQSALKLDSLRSSHPIEVGVNDATEIKQIFDAISYAKGASLIHMLYNYLGDKVFFEGISDYLQEYRYRNAKTEDLWSSLSKVSTQDISKFMNLWTKQVGYPYLDISEVIIENKTQLSIQQKRFLLSGEVMTEEYQNSWWVPLGLTSNNTEIKSMNSILKEKNKTIIISGKNYKFNKGNIGPYRVHYSQTAIKRVLQYVSKDKNFTSRDRIGLISDIAAFSQSGINSATDFFDLLQYFTKENNYYVVNQISSHLSLMQSVWFEEPLESSENYKSLFRSLFSPIVKRLGWSFDNKETISDSLLRALAIAKAGSNGDPEVIKEAHGRFNAYIKGNKYILHSDILEPVFQIIARSADNSTYNLLMKQYIEASSPELKRHYLRSLGFVSKPDLIYKSLEFSLTNKVRQQDIGYIFSALGSNPLARRATWQFIQKNWSILEKSYQNSLSNIIESTVGSLSSPQDYQQVSAFLQDKNTAKFSRALNQSLENIQTNTAWLMRDRGVVATWFNTHITLA